MADLTPEQEASLSALDRAFLERGTHVYDQIHGVVPRLARGAVGGAELYRQIEEIEREQLQREADAASGTTTAPAAPAAPVTTPAPAQAPAATPATAKAPANPQQ
jgi:hypothetical protein